MISTGSVRGSTSVLYLAAYFTLYAVFAAAIGIAAVAVLADVTVLCLRRMR